MGLGKGSHNIHPTPLMGVNHFPVWGNSAAVLGHAAKRPSSYFPCSKHFELNSEQRATGGHSVGGSYERMELGDWEKGSDFMRSLQQYKPKTSAMKSLGGCITSVLFVWWASEVLIRHNFLHR